MNGRALRTTLVVLCAVWLVAAPFAGGGVAAQAAATGDSADVAVCDSVESSGTVAVATVPGSDEPLRDDRALYAGTRLTIRLCDADGVVTPYGESGAWFLAAWDGYEIQNTTDSSVTIRLTEGYGQLTVASQVRPTGKAETGPTVTEPTPNVVQPAFGDGTLFVPTADAVGTYGEHEASYRTALNETAATTDRLESLSSAVNGSGLTDTRATNATETLRALAAATNATDRTGGEYRSYLFRVAAESPTPGVAVDAIDASREREDTVEQDAAGAVESYESALDARASDARSTVKTNLLVGLVGGLLVGVVLGGVVPYVAASSTEGRIRVDSSAEYSRKAQWLPVGVGVLVLLATVGLLVATDGLSILTVIL
ncbi:hypothetical protein [Haloarchaeobius iranensis]|uniref:Uncharacterized protein n=1 Tax=Haloarchaeobius iranensis TaxID=996166 RepID=A0A1G9UAM5_9EURY|nr:hypothetical protein [Haloarchaeobius iranensis]SDM56999.1 hypothetical protein SAMN05192554_10428 [Haloarchaeobius iranensis]